MALIDSFSSLLHSYYLTSAITSIVLGLLLLFFTSERLISHTATIGKALGLPEFLIGAFLLGFATSIPEIIVTLVSSLNGYITLAIGNALGSYMCNIGFVIAISAMVQPLLIERKSLQVDIPFMVISLIFVIALSSSGDLTKTDGLLLLMLFFIYLVYSLYFAYQSKKMLSAEQTHPSTHKLDFLSSGFLIFKILFAVFLLYLASEFIVWGATGLALIFNIPDVIIGLTMLAIGTSLPELSTSLIAIWKKQSTLALGNIIGSNIFCLLFVFVLPLFIASVPIDSEILFFNFFFMGLMSVFFWLFCAKFNHNATLSRVEGLLLFCFYLFYLITLRFFSPDLTTSLLSD